MKTKIFKKMWESGSIRILVEILIIGSVLFFFHDVKYESSWGNFYCKIQVPDNVFSDSVYWGVDTLKHERTISAWKFEGDTTIRVRFEDFKDCAKLSLKSPSYKVENFWWYDLAMDFFPANSGDRWEISLEKQDDDKYYIVCRRLLITQTYVGRIFSAGFMLAFIVFIIWNELFPRSKKKEEKKENTEKNENLGKQKS